MTQLLRRLWHALFCPRHALQFERFVPMPLPGGRQMRCLRCGHPKVIPN
jgi:hypothetical protein